MTEIKKLVDAIHSVLISNIGGYSFIGQTLFYYDKYNNIVHDLGTVCSYHITNSSFYVSITTAYAMMDFIAPMLDNYDIYALGIRFTAESNILQHINTNQINDINKFYLIDGVDDEFSEDSIKLFSELE